MFWLTGVSQTSAYLMLVLLSLLVVGSVLLFQTWQAAAIIFPVQFLLIRLLMLGKTAPHWIPLTIASRWFIGGVVGLFVGGYCYLSSSIYRRTEAPKWETRVTNSSIQKLHSSDNPQQLAGEVGDYGRFFSFPDGSWLAARYVDTHSWMVASSIVTRDSDGVWLAGNYHFCGALKLFDSIISSQRTFREELAEENDPSRKMELRDLIAASPRQTDLYDLATSTNAASARQVLISRFKLHKISPVSDLVVGPGRR